jgi:acyl transferase domain-containing protein
MNQESQSPPTIKRALQAVEKLQAKLEALESAKKEPIAIIGMGCRFPGGIDNPEAFRELLRQGKDVITKVPSDRWNLNDYYHPEPSVPGKIYSRYGGFLKQIDTFDPHFFGISKREATSLDPQQRLLLEVSWEALENANQASEGLSNSLSGVFIGICASDYAKQLKNEDLGLIDAHFGTGNTLSVAAGRLSHTLGLTGPSLAVDTACSSSLVAVHLACQHLRNRECNLALAGGVNLLLSPETSIAFSRARMLSEEGKCKTFDRDADGYVRGEGCGVIVLKRLSDALTDGDLILALIKGSAVNQNGRSMSLVAPSRLAQQEVMGQALANSNLNPQQVSYVEVQGTGTSLGGDLIELEALEQVYGKNRSLGQKLKIASVKTNIGHLEGAAGMAGLIKVILQIQNQEIYAHLNLQNPNPQINWQQNSLSIPLQRENWQTGDEAKIAGVSAFGFSGTNAHLIVAQPPVIELTSKEIHERPNHIFTISAQTEAALQDLAVRYLQYLDKQNDLSIADLCFTANTGRAHLPYCLSTIVESTEELIGKLQAFTQQELVTGLSTGKKADSIPPKIAFVFSDSIEHQADIEQLYQTQPTFRKAIAECTEIACNLLPQTDWENPTQAFINGDSDLATFVIEYALAQMWQSWGIKPFAAIAFGIGEYVAACIAGVFSLEEGLKLLVESKQSSEISFAQPQIQLIFAEQGTIANILDPELKRYYHLVAERDNAIALLKQKDYSILIEINKFLSFQESKITYLPSHAQGQNYWQKLLYSIVELYFQGVKINWAGLDCGYQRQLLSLPTYPWQRQRYWWENQQQPQTKSIDFSQIEALTHQLASSEELTPDEVQLLPKLLKLLKNKLQPHQVVSKTQSNGFNQEILETIELKTLTAANLKTWLTNRIAQDLGVTTEKINSKASFDSYGIDSVLAIGIVSEAKQRFGCDISPIMLVHYPNIESLSQYLAQEFAKSETEILEI